MTEEARIAALKKLVEKHCHCDLRWPATARVDDDAAKRFLADLAALHDQQTGDGK